MVKKDLHLELVYSIPELIIMQKYSLQEMKKNGVTGGVLDFQEDILRVLEMTSKIDMINLNAN